MTPESEDCGGTFETLTERRLHVYPPSGEGDTLEARG